MYSIVFHGHAVTLFSFARFRRPAAFATAAFAVLFADPSFVVSALSLCISAHTSSLVASAFPFAFATIAALTAVAALTAATTLAILAASPATVFATLARRVATQAASPVIFNAFASAFASLVALFAATALAAAAAATVRGISHAFAMSFGSLFAFSLCVPLQTAALAVLFASTLSARRKSTHSSAFPECIHKHGTYHTKTFDVLMHGLERYGLSRSHFCDSLSQVTQLRKDTLEDLFEDPSLLASF